MNGRLRIGTWNICGRHVGNSASGIAQAGQVSSVITQYQPDVLCLQEVHFYEGEADPQLMVELAEGNLNYIIGAPFSESHLDSRAYLGNAIASRWPLSDVSVFRLTNPGLRKPSHGPDWRLHDKGVLGCRADIPGIRSVRIHSLHLFPFHELNFDVNKRHVDTMWREFWSYIDSINGADLLIAAGDFNQEDREIMSRRWSSKDWQFCTRGRATTDWGSIDDVAISPAQYGAEVTTALTFSDHYFVLAEIVMNRLLASSVR